MKKIISALVCLSFVFQTIFSNIVLAQVLPVPSATLLPLNQTFSPALVRGITLYPENPLKFSFLVDPGDQTLSDEDFQRESAKLIRYFLAALTTPEEDMWVNLSPTEKDRIIPESFGTTDMGQELLGQDYILKQLTASLMNPDEKLGKEFWGRIYKEVNARYGSTDIPLDTLSKVWIIPDRAEVLVKDKTVVVVDSHLKVMMEGDYLNSGKWSVVSGQENQQLSTEHLALTTQIMKSIIIPAIEQEVNTGRNFALLRQIQNSAILAAWYKKNLKRSLLGESYVDQKKIDGIESEEKGAALKVYNQYLAAFKKGAYDTIKEDYNPDTQEVVTRKYVSGGLKLINEINEKTDGDLAMVVELNGEALNRPVKEIDIILQQIDYDPIDEEKSSKAKVAKIDFNHPPEWVQFVAAYYQRNGDTARLERLQGLINARNAQTGVSDDFLTQALKDKNPDTKIVSLLNPENNNAAKDFSDWLKKLRKDSLDDLKKYSSSAIVTSVAAFQKFGIFKLFEDNNGSITMQEIVDYLEERREKIKDVTHINEGNIQGVLRALVSLQWMERDKEVLEEDENGKVGRDLRFTLTDKGREVFKYAGAYQKATAFTADPVKLTAFLNGKSKDGDEQFEETLKLAMEDEWNLPKDMDPELRRNMIMQLNGRFLDPLQIALPMREYGQGILGSFDANLEMGLDQVVENLSVTDKSRVKQRLKNVFKFFEHEGLVTFKDDIVTLTAKGAAALGKRILSHGVKDSYAPTYDAVEILMFGDMNSIVWRDAEGRELMVHRKLNVESSGAAHEIYSEESGKHVETMIEERIKYGARADMVIKQIQEKILSGGIPTVEQAEMLFKETGEKFVFHVTDTGAGDAAWLKFLHKKIIDETELGERIKARPDLFGLIMIGADYNLDARELIHKNLTQARIPHLAIPADISRPEDIQEYFDGKVQKEKLADMVGLTDTILDPNNTNGIWEEASSTEVQFKPGFQPNEEQIRGIVKDKDTFDQIWATLLRVHSHQRFKALGIKMENGLHINSMLTHNRPFRPIKNKEAARNRTPVTTAVYVDSKGNPIPNRILEQNLVEYLEGWSKLAPQLLIIELGTVRTQYSLQTLDSAGYQLSHVLSGQFIMEMGPEAFFKLAGEAGYEVVEVSKYPPGDPNLTTVVVALLRRKNFQLGKEDNGTSTVVADAAQISSRVEVVNAQQAPGGIDLNPLQTEWKEHGSRIDFDKFYTPSIFSDALNVNGFVPVILNIAPPVSLPLLLGIRKEEESPKSLAQASGV